MQTTTETATIDIKVTYPRSENDDKWETVIDFRKIRKGGIPAGELLTLIKRYRFRMGVIRY